MFSQLSLLDVEQFTCYGGQIREVAIELAKPLRRNRKLSEPNLHRQMTRVFGDGWDARDSFDAVEVALQILLRERFTATMLALSDPLDILTSLKDLQGLVPVQGTKTARQKKYQQFSTPLPLAYVSWYAGQTKNHEAILEPSAGTGILASLGQIGGGRLILNEIEEKRFSILSNLFYGSRSLYSYNAEQIDDFLPANERPDVVVMNPPFSVNLNRRSGNQFAFAEHIISALKRLKPGGRLVAITGHMFRPSCPKMRTVFDRIEQYGTVILSYALNSTVFKSHGVSYRTRLTVIDKQSLDVRPIIEEGNLEKAILVIESDLPARGAVSDIVPVKPKLVVVPLKENRVKDKKSSRSLQELHEVDLSVFEEPVEVKYEVIDRESFKPHASGNYRPQRIRILDAVEHPSAIAESPVLSMIDPPIPTSKPILDKRVVIEGLLSDAQLEALIYIESAHKQFFPYLYTATQHGESLTRAEDNTGVRVRKGYCLLDGTGVGKGRTSASVIQSAFLQGHTKAIWISQSKDLMESARRDWSDLGGNKKDIFLLNRYKPQEKISRHSGIVFLTYATLRSTSGEFSRLQQLLDWVGADFEGAIIFDECHALANARAEKGGFGAKKASEQGRYGLRLQNLLPLARVVYVTATPAHKIEGLAYACRLGLWNADLDFEDREDFISRMSQGGVAACEAVSQDLKALGLMSSRTLSFEGVKFMPLLCELEPEDVSLYNQYAEVYRTLYQQLKRALVACNITGIDGQVYNRKAKLAIMSRFHSSKQSFFKHVLTSIKTRKLIPAIEKDLQSGFSVVIQATSTCEALLKRRLDEIPRNEWEDLNIDLTPREYITEFLNQAFPTHLFEVYENEEGETLSEIQMVDGNPIGSQEALELRDRLILTISTLPPIFGALDQLLWHFGSDQISEVTGRSLRIIEDPITGKRKAQKKHPSNAAEVENFMAGRKRILLFSKAGDTGASYHADAKAPNKQQRKHYLLEVGWGAIGAVQGLGRTHRASQVIPPIFCPVYTDVEGEKRFISTIAKRLAQLHALSKGQRESEESLYSENDNLENNYAERAINNLYHYIYRGRCESLSVDDFESVTGLELVSNIGELKSSLPSLKQFLNAILSIPIADQNRIFDLFVKHLDAEIEEAKRSGRYERGIETLKAEQLEVVHELEINRHPLSERATSLLTIRRVQSTKSVTVEQILTFNGTTTIHKNTGEPAMVLTASTQIMDGIMVNRVRLVSPKANRIISLDQYHQSSYEPCSLEVFKGAWQRVNDNLPRTKTDVLFLITGALLPVWKRLPDQRCRVMRLKTDDGRQILGRLVDSQFIPGIFRDLELDYDLPNNIIVHLLQTDSDKNWWLSDNSKLRSTFINGNPVIEVDTGYNLHRLFQMRNELVSSGFNFRAHGTAYRCFVGKEALTEKMVETAKECITKLGI